MATDALNYSFFTPDLDRNLVIQSKYIVWGITVSYILFTKVIGPRIMKHRKPMDLQLTMLFYNALLVAFNVYLSVRITKLAVEMFPYRCKMEDSPVLTESRKYYVIAFLGFTVKFLELFDTVIFVLRKNFHQVTFLHVFHHSIVFTLLWICLKFVLVGYHVILLSAINVTIHVALYLYYALSALGPRVRKYLWWKKYLTTLQIIQFFTVMVYMIYSSLTGCIKHNMFDKAMFVCIFLIAALFLNFYYRTYKDTKKRS